MPAAEAGGTLVALAARLARTVDIWRQRTRQRHALSELDDRLLKDIGLTRRQARREAEKPLWMR